MPWKLVPSLTYYLISSSVNILESWVQSSLLISLLLYLILRIIIFLLYLFFLFFSFFVLFIWFWKKIFYLSGFLTYLMPCTKFRCDHNWSLVSLSCVVLFARSCQYNVARFVFHCSDNIEKSTICLSKLILTLGTSSRRGAFVSGALSAAMDRILSCQGETSYEPLNVAQFLSESVEIFPDIFRSFRSWYLRLNYSKKHGGKYLQLSLKIFNSSGRLWQYSESHTAFFLSKTVLMLVSSGL